ncbi:MAG: hypothetical protein ACXVHW_11325 [Methanobacterium sp.]
MEEENTTVIHNNVDEELYMVFANDEEIELSGISSLINDEVVSEN